MADIINFISKEQKLDNWIKDCFDAMKRNDCKTALVVCKASNGDYVTGYFNMDTAEKNEAVGHIQVDILDGYLKANINKYIEYVEQ